MCKIRDKVWRKCCNFFPELQQVLHNKRIFPRGRILPAAKTFNYRMITFRTLFYPHCTVVIFVVHHEQSLGFLPFSSSLLTLSVTYLISLCPEKEIIVLEMEKVFNCGSKKSVRTRL